MGKTSITKERIKLPRRRGVPGGSVQWLSHLEAKATTVKWPSFCADISCKGLNRRCNLSGAPSIVLGGMLDDASVMILDASTELAQGERELVVAAQTEPDAAGRLFDKYYPEIFRYLYHSTLNHSVAEELTSNVFFSAFRHLRFFRWRRIPFRAWLYRIATNEVRMHYRRQKRLLAANAGPVNPEYPGLEPTAEATAAAQDDYRLLHRALRELGQKYRTVIVLRYLEGRPLAEICEITNQREGTIKSQLHRALAQLKEALVRAGVSLA